MLGQVVTYVQLQPNLGAFKLDLCFTVHHQCG